MANDGKSTTAYLSGRACDLFFTEILLFCLYLGMICGVCVMKMYLKKWTALTGTSVVDFTLSKRSERSQLCGFLEVSKQQFSLKD